MATGQKRAEARCRYYTRDEAKRLGWDVRHPAQGGQFLEEQELVDFFPALRTALNGDRPDFGALGKNGNLRILIECKNDHRKLQEAIEEAQGYADAINDLDDFDVRLAVGIAGTPDKFVRTRSYFYRGTWVPLQSHQNPLTQLPAPLELETALTNGDGTTDVILPDEKEFFDAAIHISRILRLAKIEESARPKILGAIILALYQAEFSLEKDVVVEQINANIDVAIHNFRDVPSVSRERLIETLSLSTEAHGLRTKIKDLVHQLERLNIRSIMRSGVDFLGQFYETFLRYGCDTKRMGIVFTPRHITRFCADLVGVKLGMTAYDPAAGTGGFLVAAYDRMMREATTPEAKKLVKESLHGCDTNATVWALAVLNMFFRGDGKSHISFKSCFDRAGKIAGKFDRVLLNPPYSQEGEPETDFINHALTSLTPGGEMAVVVKTSVLVDDDHAAWRRELVAKHHVLAAISLPVELFYPTTAPTLILLVKAHAPVTSGATFLAQIHNDGFTISKKRRVPATGSQLGQVQNLYQQYLSRGTIATVPNLACIVKRNQLIDGEEICAEQWLPSGTFDRSSYEYWKNNALRQIALAIANFPDAADEIIEDYNDLLAEGNQEGKPDKRATLSEWFTIVTGRSSGIKNYSGGEVPYISSGDSFNSIVNFIQPTENEIFDTPCISVTGFGQACIQPWRFCARGNGGSAVRILKPRFGMILPELFWFVGQINSQRWRFHFGRMAIVGRLENLEVEPPPSDLPASIDVWKRLKKVRAALDTVLLAGNGENSGTFFANENGGRSLEQRFRMLADRWKKERGPTSSAARMATHPAYQQIIAMGQAAVPLLLAELERQPDHWFVALHNLTGADPVPKESRGRLKEMVAAWVRWGKEHGIKW